MSRIGGSAQVRSRKAASLCPESGGCGTTRLNLQGVLEKKKTWSWKRYWFVLQGNNLSYFKDERVSSPLHQGLIDMNEANDVKISSVARGYPFEIITRTKRHLLSAATESVRDQWLDSLRRAMKIKRPMSEFGASMSRHAACNSIEDRDDVMFDQLQDMLKTGDIRSRAVSVPDYLNSPHISDSSSPGFDSNELLSGATPDHSVSDTAGQRDSGCESEPNRESAASMYDPSILRQNKRTVTRLHPTISNAEASKFIFDSIHEDDEVFQSPAKERVVVTDSGLSSISCGSVATSPLSVSSSVYEEGAFNANYPPIPDLPNPRLEMTWGASPFDQIRLFLANNRSCDEFYPTPDIGERGGKAVEKLKTFLLSVP